MGDTEEYKKDKSYLKDNKLTCVNRQYKTNSSVVNILQLLI